jgi:4-amino-4-deoxy-L-arabinose transferase-like glycosyltransferase
MAAPRSSGNLPWPITALAAALVAVPLIARLRLLQVRGFNPDEFEHLHASWCVAHGLVPYRDFFEHHTPGLYYLLAPLLRLFDTATDVSDAWAAIFAARQAMWVATIAILFLTYRLGRLWRDRLTGAVAALLLANAGIFLGKTLEVRPDVPALVFLLGSLLAFLHGLRQPAPRRWLLVVSGLLAGSALLTTQKALFVLPGFVLALAVKRGEAPVGRRSSLQAGGIVLLALAAPLVLCLAYFASAGALWSFIDCNVILNARWRHRLGPRGVFVELLQQDAALLALGLLGFARALWALRARSAGSFALCAWMASLLAGAFVIPVVQRQYALLFLPLLAVFAGSVASDAWKWGGTRAGALWVLGGLMILGSVQPTLRLRAAFGRTNGGTLENIRYLQRNTSPEETVLDGFTGEGVFRPHAYHYFFLHDEIRLMLPAGEREKLLGALQSGSVAPKVVLYDRHLRDLSPPLSAFLEEHYVDVGREPIRVRLFDNGRGTWDDEGWRRLAGPAGPPLLEPHLLIGEGWQRVESGEGRRFRGSRGRRSYLSVPVRNPGPYRVVLRASGRPAGEPIEVELLVNGQPLGVTAVGGWRDYELAAVTPSLRHGLNDFVLVPRGEAGILVEALRLLTIQ